MKFEDLLQETFSALLANKVRSCLTMLGIVIGIGSVIAMVSIGQGAAGQIQASIESIGSNLIMVMPGYQRGVGSAVRGGRGGAVTLTWDDAKFIEQQVAFIKAVSPELSGGYQITARGTNAYTQVIGSTPSYQEVKNVEMEQGAFISQQNINGMSKVAVLGPTTRDDLFGENVNPVGQKIKINRISFTIVGVTKTKGGTGFMNQDDMVFVPLSTAQRFLAGNENVSIINIQAENQKVMANVQQQVTNILLQRHNISNPDEADFNVLNQADIMSAASDITGTFTILLASIAGISLLVGGIGIMNMMFTTVTERTREIGLRKAIGAKKKDISWQFLAEAVMLTFVGGFIGILLGWLISFIISKAAGITTSISIGAVLLSFGVSAGIGIVFGFWPSRRAAKLNPIEALRYE